MLAQRAHGSCSSKHVHLWHTKFVEFLWHQPLLLRTAHTQARSPGPVLNIKSMYACAAAGAQASC
jgi:hypothetical protein